MSQINGLTTMSVGKGMTANFDKKLKLFHFVNRNYRSNVVSNQIDRVNPPLNLHLKGDNTPILSKSSSMLNCETYSTPYAENKHQHRIIDMKLDISEKNRRKEQARNLYYNANLSPKEIAKQLDVNPRTIYRWLKNHSNQKLHRETKKKQAESRPRKYSEKIFERILSLKKENPVRSAVIIRNLLEQEFKEKIPSISTIRKFLAAHNLGRRSVGQPKGYITFERKHPNDLWQVDIGGVQTVGHLGKLYLFAFIDDCTRFIPAAFYARSEKSANVFRLLQIALEGYGRPNQILADRGTQFCGTTVRENSKFYRFLKMIGVDPIYSRVRHPETKGKLERWFGTVNQSFLAEARFVVKSKPNITLKDFNEMLANWVHWYNYQKPHRSLPKNKHPADIYFDHPDRIYRPLKSEIRWDLWTSVADTRMVLKTNNIHFRGQKLEIPPGYRGRKVDLYLFNGNIDVYYRETFLISHEIPDNPLISINKQSTRRVSSCGTIGWGGSYYTVSYKMAGKEVVVKEKNDGREILIYLEGNLIRTLSKKKSKTKNAKN